LDEFFHISWSASFWSESTQSHDCLNIPPLSAINVRALFSSSAVILSLARKSSTKEVYFVSPAVSSFGRSASSPFFISPAISSETVILLHFNRFCAFSLADLASELSCQTLVSRSPATLFLSSHLDAEFASWNAGSHSLFSRSLAFNSLDGVEIPVPIIPSGSFSVRYFFQADNPAQAHARPPQSKAPVPSSVGVPILHSLKTLYLPVSIAHCTAHNPIFPKVHTSFAFHNTPPGVTIEEAIAQVVNPPLYAHSFCTLKACLLHFSNDSFVSRANCPSQPLFHPVNIQP